MAANRRSGSTTQVFVVLLVIALSTAGIIWYVLATRPPSVANLPLTTVASRGPFDHIVLEHGEVESSSNIEVQCQVKSRNSSGTMIIDVIPEGTTVKKGDWLVTLDASALQDEMKTQTVIVNTSNALVISAEAAFEQAEIARTEYLEGTFLQEEQTIESEILIAEEKLSRAKENAEYSKRLAALGFQTAQQLKADLFAVEQADVELRLAQGKLKTLREITKRKMLVGFDSDIEAAAAKLNAEKNSHEEEVSKLKDIEQQIQNCTIHAPAAGQVVYANIMSRRGNSAEFVVEPGAFVREQQTIVRLPDPQQMQVKATINESRITLVAENMPVDIRIGAFDENRSLKGEVRKVNKYAEPGSWFSSQVKEYATYISILDPPPDIRTGMTAEVRIQVDRQDNALQVPVQAVYEHKAHTFVLVQTSEDQWETREITMGATNDKQIVIEGGLDEGDVVVLNPRKHLDKFQFPDLPDPRAQPQAETVALAEPEPVSDTARRVQRTLADFDQDQDGSLSAQEVASMPARRQERMNEADGNGDGTVDRAELTRSIATSANRQGAGDSPRRTTGNGG